jgi:hypothetical protein
MPSRSYHMTISDLYASDIPLIDCSGCLGPSAQWVEFRSSENSAKIEIELYMIGNRPSFISGKPGLAVMISV